MSRARTARRIAAGAAYGGGGLGLVGAAAVGLVVAEMQFAKRTVGTGLPDPPHADGLYGSEFGGPELSPGPLRLGMLGDSTAAGLGVRRARQTPGALLASGLAAVAERPVELRNVALCGAMSDDLDRQTGLLLDGDGPAPDVCVIMIGANDVTRRMPPTQSVRLLTSAVRRLRLAGSEVVVGTCPDLGTIEPVYQPLRWLARRVSRQLAAAQTIGVLALGARTVSIGDLMGTEFAANPREMFGPDSYHPSAEGYATAAMAVLPTLCAALGVWPESDRLDVSRNEDMLPVAKAASAAAGQAGTEVTAARGPWALLKYRRRRRVPGEDLTEQTGGTGGAATAARTGGKPSGTGGTAGKPSGTAAGGGARATGVTSQGQ